MGNRRAAGKVLEDMHPVWVIMLIAVISGLLSGITTNAVFAFGEEIAWRGFLIFPVSVRQVYQQGEDFYPTFAASIEKTLKI